MLLTCEVTSRTFRELSGSFDAPVLAASLPDHAGGLQKEIFQHARGKSRRVSGSTEHLSTSSRGGH